jgi:hypothetical protein
VYIINTTTINTNNTNNTTTNTADDDGDGDGDGDGDDGVDGDGVDGDGVDGDDDASSPLSPLSPHNHHSLVVTYAPSTPAATNASTTFDPTATVIYVEDSDAGDDGDDEGRDQEEGQDQEEDQDEEEDEETQMDGGRDDGEAAVQLVEDIRAVVQATDDLDPAESARAQQQQAENRAQSAAQRKAAQDAMEVQEAKDLSDLLFVDKPVSGNNNNGNNNGCSGNNGCNNNNGNGEQQQRMPNELAKAFNELYKKISGDWRKEAVCLVCCDRPRGYMYRDCGHFAVCAPCYFQTTANNNDESMCCVCRTITPGIPCSLP